MGPAKDADRQIGNEWHQPNCLRQNAQQAQQMVSVLVIPSPQAELY